MEGRVAIQYVNAMNPKVPVPIAAKNPIHFLGYIFQQVTFFRTTSHSSVTEATELSMASRQDNYLLRTVYVILSFIVVFFLL